MPSNSNIATIDRQRKFRIVRLTLVFFIVGLSAAAFFAFLGMPWNDIFVLVPWLAIVGILVLTVNEGASRATRFKKSVALEEYQKFVWTRGIAAENEATLKASADRAVAYADRLVDRQINKARGILPFNSLIMTVFSLERPRMPASGKLLWDLMALSAFVAILVILGISSWLCLDLFFVYWGRREDYGDYNKEVCTTLELFVTRSINIQWATVLSEGSLFVGLCLVIMIEGSKLIGPAATLVR